MLEKLFKLSEHNTDVRTEVVAGLTTFLTMAYILFVNPDILSITGMDKGSLFTATAVSAAFGCILMGLLANFPVALAPAMGLNAFFHSRFVDQWVIPGKKRSVRYLLPVLSSSY